MRKLLVTPMQMAKTALAVVVLLGFGGCASRAPSSSPDSVADGGIEQAGAADVVMSASAAPSKFEALHMELTPAATPTSSDSARATAVVRELRRALTRYRDTSAAAADGYRIFAPQLKGQRVYHFTSRSRAVGEAFRWDPAKPTSLLYSRDAAGRFTLVGAMYTMPARASHEKLDERVPLSIARWHRHVNWCVPPAGERARWLEQRNGAPVFGPQSPIATRAGCDAVRGNFHERVFGWMVHANVFAGNDLATIFGEEHHGAAPARPGDKAGGHSGHHGH